VLQLDAGADERGFVVITQAGGQTFGAVVDNVFHTEEIVIKPLSSRLRHIGMFSGMTILGDGSVIMVLDPNALAQTLGRVTQSASNGSADTAQRERTPHPDAVSLLLFRAGSQRHKAVPLSLITRIEDIDCRRIEVADGQHLLPCQRELPDAILLDWNMPKMDGYDFLRVLRGLPGGERPKVVFCTTENDVAHIARALQAGANEYIMKPFDKDIVESKFQEIGLI
jgi:CheY-like chemotaxis protein